MSKAYTQQLTSFKNTLSFAPPGAVLGPEPVLVPPASPALTQAGIFTFIAGLVARIKASTNYSPGIGEALGQFLWSCAGILVAEAVHPPAAAADLVDVDAPEALLERSREHLRSILTSFIAAQADSTGP